MTDSSRDDPIWQAALGWVMREHEQALDVQACAELADWLAQSPAHRLAYEEAHYLWRLTGLLPPSSD